MAVFSSYTRVDLPDGSAMPVRTALSLINQVLAEMLDERLGDVDAQTRWAVAWFDQHDFDSGTFGDADNLARSSDTAVNALVESGILTDRPGGKRGFVALIPREDLPDDWDPATDRRTSTWEVTLHLIKALERGGVSAAGDLMRRCGGRGAAVHDLAYGLFEISERRGWTGHAQAVNSLVTSWPDITRAAAARRETATYEQPTLG
jgi:putative DNA methylase